MKRLLAVALVALLVVSVTYAGDTIVPKTKAGNKAVLFTLGGLANLSAGQRIGMRSLIAPVSEASTTFEQLGGRLGIGFSTSTSTTKNPASPTPAGQSR